MKIKNRQRFNSYYEKNKEKFVEKNKQQYQKKKENGFSDEELKYRRASNRKAYYERKHKNVLDELNRLKEEASEDRKVLIDEIIKDNDYSNFRKETLSVIALLVKKKETEETS